ncbi:MAG: PH domain-containing protein [Planctomycetota bacterium]
MSSVRKSVYPSAVDWWVAFILIAAPAICVVLTGVLLTRGDNHGALICLVTGVGSLVITAAFSMPCRYTILADTLSIRCGLIVQRVPLGQIRAIEPSSSLLSGPALSLRRVKVSTPSRFYLISPSERERFIEELSEAVRKVD